MLTFLLFPSVRNALLLNDRSKPEHLYNQQVSLKSTALPNVPLCGVEQHSCLPGASEVYFIEPKGVLALHGLSLMASAFMRASLA